MPGEHHRLNGFERVVVHALTCGDRELAKDLGPSSVIPETSRAPLSLALSAKIRTFFRLNGDITTVREAGTALREAVGQNSRLILRRLTSHPEHAARIAHIAHQSA